MAKKIVKKAAKKKAAPKRKAVTAKAKPKKVKAKAKPKAKSTTKRKSPKKFMEPKEISADLAAVVGKGPMPRTEVTKKLWVYIKKNKLQDEKNRRNINPDAALAKVFGSKKPINMFQMTKLVSKHIK
jgi:chromatin remodeling complex protein RSC6